MKKSSLFILLLACLFFASADVTTMYGSKPKLTNGVTSESATVYGGFKLGWYADTRDVTYIKLIKVDNNIGLSILFSSTGVFCPINNYLPFIQESGSPYKYVYTVGNGCKATISTNPSQNSFVMTVNSSSKCFEETTYEEFCNGNLDVHMIDEEASRYFIDQTFTYAKDQNDDNYDWNDD